LHPAAEAAVPPVQNSAAEAAVHFGSRKLQQELGVANLHGKIAPKGPLYGQDRQAHVVIELVSMFMPSGLW